MLFLVINLDRCDKQLIVEKISGIIWSEKKSELSHDQGTSTNPIDPT